jgi:hypothetical protein
MFTQIEGEEVVIPPVEAKVFNKKWLKHLRVNSESPTGETVLIAQLIPYDGVSGILEEPIEVVEVHNLFNKMQKFPKIAQAMELIFQSLVDYRAYKKEVDSVRAKQIEQIELNEEELALLQEANSLQI